MALPLSKDLLNRSFDMTIEQALEAEAYGQVVNLTGPDVAEARVAFLEKREPAFRGQQADRVKSRRRLKLAGIRTGANGPSSGVSRDVEVPYDRPKSP